MSFYDVFAELFRTSVAQGGKGFYSVTHVSAALPFPRLLVILCSLSLVVLVVVFTICASDLFFLCYRGVRLFWNGKLFCSPQEKFEYAVSKMQIRDVIHYHRLLSRKFSAKGAAAMISLDLPALLCKACRSGDPLTVRFLLKMGATKYANDTDKSGWAPLHYALSCPSSSLAKVRSLIRAGADVNVGTSRGVTPLHFAARKGLEEETGALLAANALPNAQDDRGCTALHHLCFAPASKQISVARRLLAAGASPRVMTVQKVYPHELARERCGLTSPLTVLLRREV